MEKIWLKSYPTDIPETIGTDNYSSLNDFIEQQCQQYKDLVAFENFGATLSFHEFNYLSYCFAAYLQKQCLLKKNDRIAIMLPNILQFPIAMFGAFKAGLIIVNVNPLYTARELAYQLKNSDASAIVILENFASILQKILPETNVQHVIVTRIGDCLSWLRGAAVNFAIKYILKKVPPWNLPNAHFFKDILKRGKTFSLETPAIYPDDIAFLQYTGGTTGVSKGAILLHRNIIANVNQCLSWIRPIIKEGTEVVITALPLYHIFSLTGCFFFMGIGSKALLITNPRDTKMFVRILAKNTFSVIVGLNTLFNSLLHQKEFSRLDFSCLKLIISGGMALQASVAQKWQEVTGVVILEGYGLTEASPVVSINPTTIKSFNGSVGLPIPSTEVEIRDTDGEILSIGREGELWVRGPQVMAGYWQKPKETIDVLQNGWLRTGDIAKLDDRGFIYIVDRLKDMIIVSGFNVYPNEIEEVIASHPDVREVAVIGIPSENTGELVKAFVVRNHPQLTQAELIAYCHERLTNYKVPKQVVFCDELPKSNVGKVLRRALR